MKSGFKLNKITFKLREGDKAGNPDECAIGGKWVDKTTDDFFKGKESFCLAYQELSHQLVHHNNYQVLKIIVNNLKNQELMKFIVVQ